MNKTILYLLIFTIVACNSKTEIPKPEKPIEKEVMEKILYDLAVLQALKSYSPEKLSKNSINSKTYIYQKYKIDSLQFAQNSKYYASDIEAYKIMYQKVSDKLVLEKKNIDTIISRETKIKTKKTKDSLLLITKKLKEKKIKDLKKIIPVAK
ncbi:DUF4296 domain-containing protein [Flavobacterium sp.]|uniref:DUF4296 domain-containing protein n=1 Tax=Flavobacterium sp. TaxID=239 RepID=UPI002869F6A0|nr:DUF4296 domain-containing protein [Flavobacterium sp.]